MRNEVSGGRAVFQKINPDGSPFFYSRKDTESMQYNVRLYTFPGRKETDCMQAYIECVKFYCCCKGYNGGSWRIESHGIDSSKCCFCFSRFGICGKICCCCFPKFNGRAYYNSEPSYTPPENDWSTDFGQYPPPAVHYVFDQPKIAFAAVRNSTITQAPPYISDQPSFPNEDLPPPVPKSSRRTTQHLNLSI